MRTPDRLRPSSLPRWGRCHKRAAHELRHPPKRFHVHVSAYVGTMAHSMLERDNDEPLGKRPEFVEYDDITRTDTMAVEQARDLYRAAASKLADDGLEPLHRELKVMIPTASGLPVIGTLDMVARDPVTGQTAVIDFKTGGSIVDSWPQVLVYALGATKLSPAIEPAYFGILHVPRRPTWEVVRPSLELRDFDATARAEAVAIAEQLAVVATAPWKEALPSPGRHCANCPLTQQCAVAPRK